MDKAPTRRFLTASDFEAHLTQEEGHRFPTLVDNPLFAAFENLLISILKPAFEEVYHDLPNGGYPVGKSIEIAYRELFDDKNNVVIFPVSLNGNFSVTRTEDRELDLSIIVERYCTIKSKITESVQKTIYPTIKSYLLESHGLSEEQFVIKTVDVTIEPQLTLPPYTAPEELMGYFNTLVKFYLSIEDISEYAPGEMEALRLRFNNLCLGTGRYPENELRSWAVSLGLTGVERFTKDQLCNAIRNHYGF